MNSRSRSVSQRRSERSSGSLRRKVKRRPVLCFVSAVRPSGTTREPCEICGHKSCAAYDINYLFPLYLRQGSLGLGKGAMGGPSEGENGFDDREGRAPNINSDFLNTVADRLRLRFVPEGRGNLQTTVGPEDILHYIYAVCHSPRFRSRYAEFLKRDFPHIQLTSSGDVFRGLCKLGERLVSSHLFLTPGSGSVRFPQKGTDTVGIVRFS